MNAPSIKVLVIDDEPAIRKLLRMGLSTQGYDILEASNGKLALEKLAEGLSAKELASLLFVSTDTINAHLKHIYKKLHVRSRVEAVLTYLKAKGPGE